MCENILKWICKSRKEWSHNNDFWDFKYQLSKDKSLLSKLSMNVATATHDFSPARRVIKVTITWIVYCAKILLYKQPSCHPSA